MYYQDIHHAGSFRPAGVKHTLQSHGTAVNSSYPNMGHQPPQVVRRNPMKPGLQDFLVASIETASSDVSSLRKAECNGFGVHDAFNHPRVVDPRTQTPLPRQVIVLDDDSPKVKRRRLVREDDAGHFRPIPSRDHLAYPPASYSDSLMFKPSSSIHSGARNPSPPIRHTKTAVQTTQGMSRVNQSFFTDPGTGERLPIYDAQDFSRVQSRPSYLGARRDGLPAPPRDVVRMGQVGYNIHDDQYRQKPADMHDISEPLNSSVRASVRQFGLDHSLDQMMASSSGNSTSYRPSRLNVSGPSSDGPDQAFIHRFSQSNLNGFNSNGGDSFDIPPARYQQSPVSVGQSNFPYHQESSTRSHATAFSGRVASPAECTERST